MVTRSDTCRDGWGAGAWVIYGLLTVMWCEQIGTTVESKLVGPMQHMHRSNCTYPHMWICPHIHVDIASHLQVTQTELSEVLSSVSSKSQRFSSAGNLFCTKILFLLDALVTSELFELKFSAG